MKNKKSIVLIVLAIVLLFGAGALGYKQYRINNPRVQDLEFFDYDHGTEGSTQIGYSKETKKQYVVTHNGKTGKTEIRERKDKDGNPIYFKVTKATKTISKSGE